MALPKEDDYPRGHPGRFDYDPKSPEAIEWRRQHYNPKGERDWPVGHPAAADTPGNKNNVVVLAGVDPDNPHLEPFTGRTPEQAAALREALAPAAAVAKPSEPLQPTIAPEPPPPGSTQPPPGQPGA